jgi:glyoxylase-like metal-dependent hydrolase (beta-lactamase superfamily II)
MSLVFRKNFDPRYGQAVEVAPGVRRVTAENPGPFTFRGTNTFLIGEAEIVVLDPGPDDRTHLDALATALAGRRVAAILVSHAHRDHSAGAAALQEATGAPVLAAAPAPAAAAPPETQLDAAAARGFAPDEARADGALVETPGFRLEAIATPGHAPDHLVFALADAGLLFSADHVMGWSTTVVAPPEGSMADYMASLDRLLGRPEQRYLPAHGDAIDDGPAHVRALKAHRKLRERAILERLLKGDRTAEEIVPRVYAGLDPRLMRAAALSTLAHLEHLVARGHARTDGAPALAARFEPV